jgi:hypothetical protein
MSLESLSAEEHQMILDAERRFGPYYVNAYNTTILLSKIVMWPVTDCDVFLRFLSQMKKYHTLTVFSIVRLHRIQAKMNLRYFLESTVNAAFALTHDDWTIYFDPERERQPDARKASLQAYRWIEQAYGEHSQIIQHMKKVINEQTAHANVFNSQHNFNVIPGPRAEIITSYFDFEDEEWVKADLWQCAQAGLIAIDLLLAVQKRYGGFLPSTETNGLASLIVENDALLKTLEAARGQDSTEQ